MDAALIAKAFVSGFRYHHLNEVDEARVFYLSKVDLQKQTKDELIRIATEDAEFENRFFALQTLVILPGPNPSETQALQVFRENLSETNIEELATATKTCQKEFTLSRRRLMLGMIVDLLAQTGEAEAIRVAKDVVSRFLGTEYGALLNQNLIELLNHELPK